LPLATLYEAPAIEDIARILQGESLSPGWSSLVPIQSSGSRPPLFCFHGAGGNVLIYRALSRYLGSDQPFYGLQSRGLDGKSPLLRTIEEMAALYVKEIRDVQPHGPYLLGGYCLGGSIAYEAAQQLHAAGEEVALLALFDTMNWHKVPLKLWHKSSLACQRLLFHFAALADLDFRSKRKFVSAKWADVRRRIPVWWGNVLTRVYTSHSAADASSMVQARIWRTNHSASLNYIPRPYPGAVTDFRPLRQYRILNRPDLKWGHLAKGGQQIIPIPGYPAVMLIEPYVKHLALALAKSINSACRCESIQTGEGKVANFVGSGRRTASGGQEDRGVYT
jgi:phthiocerol/phenolphthiocerol synthesis type-I polyketide synthase E